MRWTIRWRLTLWNTLALAAVLACFSALVYGLLRRALYEQTERLLVSALGQLQSDPQIETDPDECFRHTEESGDHLNLRGFIIPTAPFAPGHRSWQTSFCRASRTNVADDEQLLGDEYRGPLANTGRAARVCRAVAGAAGNGRPPARRGPCGTFHGVAGSLAPVPLVKMVGPVSLAPRDRKASRNRRRSPLKTSAGDCRC